MLRMATTLAQIDLAAAQPMPAPRRLERAAELAAQAAELLREALAIRGEQAGSWPSCDLSAGAVALCVELTVERPNFVIAMIADAHAGAAIRVDGERGGASRLYVALPAAGPHGGAAATVMLARRLAARLRPYGVVGISSFHAGPDDIDAAIREAELVLDAVRHAGASSTEEICGGTYRLLCRLLASHPSEVRDFYDATIAPMVSYDEHNRTELVGTLRAYLEADCNMNVTASAVFAHRHTIASRLERIRELTGLDPARYEDRERLGLGLKVHRLLAPQLETPQRRGAIARA
jgi:hypothetical protein